MQKSYLICNNTIFQNCKEHCEEQRLLKMQFYFVCYHKKLTAISYICRRRVPLKELIPTINSSEFFCRIPQNGYFVLFHITAWRIMRRNETCQNVSACEGFILLCDAIESRPARLFLLPLVPHKKYVIFIVSATDTNYPALFQTLLDYISISLFLQLVRSSNTLWKMNTFKKKER